MEPGDFLFDSSLRASFAFCSILQITVLRIILGMELTHGHLRYQNKKNFHTEPYCYVVFAFFGSFVSPDLIINESENWMRH